MPNCPRCQIVHGAKLSAVPNCSHWAIGVGNSEEELLWMEIDGGGGRQKKRGGKRNTINGHGSSSWRNESPWELMHCGEVSRLGAVRSNEVGRTRKSDEEICDFVANYLSKHRTYHMITEMLGSVNFDNKNGYSMVPNCPWCQIVRGAKLFTLGNRGWKQ